MDPKIETEEVQKINDSLRNQLQFNKDKKEIKQDGRNSISHKPNNGSVSINGQKNKYETAQQQQEYIQKSMDKYKQIFDSNFLNEEEQNQKQAGQQYNGSSSLQQLTENQQPSQNQNNQKNIGSKPQFKYNSQGNLSPRKNEISIIQSSNNQQQSYLNMVSNNDLSTTFIPKNIFEDIFTQTNQNNNQQQTSTNYKNKKGLSTTKLEPIIQQQYRENELSNDHLRMKSRNASMLLGQQKKAHLKNIKLNQDISYYREQKEQRYSTHIDSSTVMNTHIMKNPANLFHSTSDQKKGNVYVQMYDHSHHKDKFDTDITSIQNKINSEDIIKKSISQQNMHSQNVSNILSQTGAKILDIQKKPFQLNLTNNPINLSLNTEQKTFIKKSITEMNSNRQLQPISQNSSMFYNANSSITQFKPNKEVLFTKPTNRNETKSKLYFQQLQQEQKLILFQIYKNIIHQVLELEGWLNDMIDKVELTDQMNMKDVYNQIQVIYSACMKELIRQITIQCKDRGNLLSKVWDSYLDLLQRGMQQTQDVKSGEEKEHLDEVTRIHKMYDQSIKLVEKELEKKKKECKEQTKSSEQLTDAIHYFRKKLKTYENEIKKMQQIEDELRFELEASLSENLKLKLIQGENKQHDENHGKNSNHGSLANTAIDQQQLQNVVNQDVQIIKSIAHIAVDTGTSKKPTLTNLKGSEKKSKVSVVSHLINFNKKLLVDDEEDEKKKNTVINQFKMQMQDRDNMSEDSEIFGDNGDNQNSNREKNDEIDFFFEDEQKLQQLQMPDIELFDIKETGVQTDEIKYSDNDHINFLIKQLAHNQMIADAEPNLILQYQQSYQIVRQSQLEISEKETVLAALDQCKLQVNTYQQLASLNGELSKENSDLKTQNLDLGIQLKESQQNYQDKKRRWKKKAITYIEKIQNKDELIQELEQNSIQMEQKIIKNYKEKKLVSVVMGKFLKKNTIKEESESNINESIPEDTNPEQPLITEDSEGRIENLNDLLESVEAEKQQDQQLPELQSQGMMRVLSKFIGDDINKENVEFKANESLNKILLKLGGKGLFSSQGNVDSPMNKSRRLKGSITDSKKLLTAVQNKQTKRVYSQNTTVATNIVENILKKKNQIKNAVVPLSSIQKFFTHVYQELLKNEKGHRIPLHVSCFDILMQKHILKSVAEDKLARSVYIYKTKNIKMEMVSTFLGLNTQFDEIDYYYFLLGLKYFQNINQNILNLNSELGLILIEKAIEFINFYFSDKLGKFQQIQYKKLIITILKIEKEQLNKLITDVKMTSTQKGIEYEMLLKKCLYYYQEKKEKTKKHIEDLFYATDLDGNDQIEMYEFDLIYKYIEKKNYNADKVEELFFEESDNINPSNGEKALSLNKFVNLAVQRNLFSQEKCQHFLESSQDQWSAENFDELKQNSNDYKKQIKNRFLKAGKFMSEIKKIIKALFKQICDPAPARPNSLWISYLLMEQESKRLLLDYEANSILQSLLPLKLQMLDIVAKRFEEII